MTPVSIEDIEEIYQLRALLEGEAVVKALPFLGEEEIAELENINDKMLMLKANEYDMEEFMSLNADFHRTIREGSPWRRIQSFIETLWKGIPPYTPSLLANHLSESHKEHGLMLQAIKDQDDEKLREVTVRHILRTKDNLIRMMSEK